MKEIWVVRVGRLVKGETRTFFQPEYISSEGYANREQAIDFIEQTRRATECEKVYGVWEDKVAKIAYTITPISIKRQV